MTKETIFGEEFEDFEFDGVTSDVDAWWEKQLIYGGDSFTQAANDMYEDILKVKYFMMGPTVRFGYETVSAKTVLTDDISDLSKMIAEHGSNFMLLAVFKERYKVLSPTTSKDEVYFDLPTKYKIRYAIKNQTELNIDSEKYFDNPRIARPSGRPGGYYIPRGEGEFVETT